MRRQRQVPNEGWRWLALLVVLVNVSFNYFIGNFIPGSSIMEVGNVYQSLYSPAAYAYAIWPLIGFSAIFYAIYQLVPSHSDDRLYDELAKPFIVTNLFMIAWIGSMRLSIEPLAMFFV